MHLYINKKREREIIEFCSFYENILYLLKSSHIRYINYNIDKTDT